MHVNILQYQYMKHVAQDDLVTGSQNYFPICIFSCLPLMSLMPILSSVPMFPSEGFLCIPLKYFSAENF